MCVYVLPCRRTRKALLLSSSLAASNNDSLAQSAHYSEAITAKHFPRHTQHEFSSSMIHQNPSATESYFFFDNAAPTTGKRAYPLLAADGSWQQHHGSRYSADTRGRQTSEPVPKKARVVSDDEHEEPPSTMNLNRVKRALQQLEIDESLVGRDAKRAKLEVLVAGPQPPSPQVKQETRMVLHPKYQMQEAEKAIFNSLLLQRISNRYGASAPIQLDLVDSRLQELIRNSMQRSAITWNEDDHQTMNTSSTASCLSSDVAMEEDDHLDEDSGESSEECSMMTF